MIEGKYTYKLGKKEIAMDKPITLTKNCVCCNKELKIIIPKQYKQNYLDWVDGALIQDALHFLTVEEREMLISGICSECFDYLFGGDQDEEN